MWLYKLPNVFNNDMISSLHRSVVVDYRVILLKRSEEQSVTTVYYLCEGAMCWRAPARMYCLWRYTQSSRTRRGSYKWQLLIGYLPETRASLRHFCLNVNTVINEHIYSAILEATIWRPSKSRIARNILFLPRRGECDCVFSFVFSMT